MRHMTTTAALVLATAGPALATGVLIPKDQTLPTLAIKSHRVEVAIDNQVATTKVTQIFVNHTNRDLEAKYVFPLPKAATIRDFAIMVNGKRTSGELVEKDKAARVYQSIVRRMKDPGLLEYLGNHLFRVNIYPVPKNGTQTVELSYSEVVRMDGGIARYVYPLRTGEKASQTMDDFTLGVFVKSAIPIKSLYSPTHEVGQTIKNDHEATAGFEKNQALLDRDFELYVTVSKKQFGLNMLAYRPDAGKDGYFMLLVSPASSINENRRIPRDFSFVFDTSGSMSGEKIEQAKAALKYCISRLRAKDRFNIIRFSTDVEPYLDKMTDASKTAKGQARNFIDKLEANGGTNINDALLRAVQHDPGKRPHVVIFLTDGRPTIGTTDQKQITRNVLAKRDASLRIFSFGVGHDVNPVLLDAVSGETGGVTEYVAPREDIEVKVSSFFDKAGHPVLANLDLDVPGVGAAKLYPRKLPDLYRGTQLVVFGRYDKLGDTAIRLSGTVGEKTETFAYDATFPKLDVDHSFIAPLWAQQRIAFLLDQIRLNGESAELKDEVIALGKEYGIQTPYTSYLVLESATAYKDHGIARGDRDVEMSKIPWTKDIMYPKNWRELSDARTPADMPAEGRGPGGDMGGGSGPGRGTAGEAPAAARPPAAGPAPDAALDQDKADDYSRLARRFRRASEAAGNERLKQMAEAPAPSPAEPGTDGEAALRADARREMEQRRGRLLDAADEKKRQAGWRDQGGKGAVDAAEQLNVLRRTRNLAELQKNQVTQLLAQRNVQGRNFYQIGRVWVDERFAENQKITTVRYGSEAYFAILARRPAMKEVFSQGTRLVVNTARNQSLVIDEDAGVETLDHEAIDALFVDLPTTQPATAPAAAS